MITVNTYYDKAKNELSNRQLAIEIAGLSSKELNDLYKKYLKIKDKSNDYEKELPEIFQINKKLSLNNYSPNFLLTMLNNAVLIKFERINNTTEYIIYLLQQKLNLIKDKLPGADNIKKQLDNFKNNNKNIEVKINDLVNYYKEKDKKLHTDLAKSIFKLTDKQLINLYKKSKSNQKEIFYFKFNIKYRYSKKIFELFPELVSTNKKLNIDESIIFENPLIIIDTINSSLSRKIKVVRNNEDYLIYLVQRKLGLIKHNLPGAQQVEKELGIK